MGHATCRSKLEISLLLDGFSACVRAVFLDNDQPQQHGVICRRRINIDRGSKFHGEIQRACDILGYLLETWNELYVVKIP